MNITPFAVVGQMSHTLSVVQHVLHHYRRQFRGRITSPLCRETRERHRKQQPDEAKFPNILYKRGRRLTVVIIPPCKTSNPQSPSSLTLCLLPASARVNHTDAQFKRSQQGTPIPFGTPASFRPPPTKKLAPAIGRDI